MTKVTAVIVARKGSTRIPHKMHACIKRETLLMRKIRQLKATPGVDEIIVGTDCLLVKDAVESAGAVFAFREAKYCDEKSSTVNEMVKDMLSKFESDVVLWAHPTNPFICDKYYSEALEIFYKKNSPDGLEKSVFCLTGHKGHFWSHDKVPLNFDPHAKIHLVAADLPLVYSQNGGIFIRSYEGMAKDGCFISPHGGTGYNVTPVIGWDIDEPWQLEFAQHYARYRNI